LVLRVVFVVFRWPEKSARTMEVSSITKESGNSFSTL
jgi:hypothetical protein